MHWTWESAHREEKEPMTHVQAKYKVIGWNTIHTKVTASL